MNGLRRARLVRLPRKDHTVLSREIAPQNMEDRPLFVVTGNSGLNRAAAQSERNLLLLRSDWKTPPGQLGHTGQTSLVRSSKNP